MSQDATTGFQQRTASRLISEIDAARAVMGDDYLAAVLIDAYGLLDIEAPTERFVAWFITLHPNGRGPRAAGG